MQNLNDTEAIRKIDPKDTLGSTEKSVEQMEAAWQQVQALEVPQDYTLIKNIVGCGMGASIYGALVLKALLGSSSKYPMETISDYHLPQYVGSDTLVILTSYSGTTEEVLSCAEEAKKKGAKMLVLTKGGPLAEFAKTNNIPAYIFDGKLNPAGVPRLGNGYSILGLIGLLNKAGVTSLPNEKIVDAVEVLKGKVLDIKAKAMKDAALFVGKVPVIFAAEHLSGNAQIFRNQFNETSKTFSAFYLIPDLNHHLMEGLQFPEPTNLKFIVLKSKNYSPKIQKRVDLTIKVVQQNKQDVFEYQAGGKTIYEDVLEVIVYGSYLTLFLGLLYDQNPAINPWVDYFKEQLAK